MHHLWVGSSLYYHGSRLLTIILTGIEPPFTPFRDAAFCINTFPITVLDCARACYKASQLNHFSYRTFSLPNFTTISKLENGDFSWIIPGKFIAFSGPVAK